MRRYVVLDSWRGLCACLVVLFHFKAYSHFYFMDFVKNAWIFVDFFFVLSGFVISGAYSARLLAGSGPLGFLWLRIGRLYPLHLFTLALLVAVETVMLLVPALGNLSPDGVFASEGRSPAAILSNLLLIQSLNIHDTNTWNFPSWSISVEFWTYILYLAILLAFRRRFLVAAAAIAVAIPAAFLLFPETFGGAYILVSHHWGILRCLYGFCLGMLVQALHARLAGPRLPGAFWWGAEALALLLVWLAVTGLAVPGTSPDLPGEVLPASMGAPFVFAFTVLVFAAERGPVSAVLSLRLPVLLGTLSYSIYMMHAFVQDRIKNAGQVAEKLSGVELFTRGIDERPLFGRELWQGDLLVLLMFVLVILVSWVTWAWVEMPARDWFRRRAPGGAPTGTAPA